MKDKWFGVILAHPFEAS